MIYYDEVLKQEVEVQEEITPDKALEMKLKNPKEFKETIGEVKQ